jgi:hypothetical protein
MIARLRVRLVFTAVFATAICGGCRQEGPDVAPVSGMVTLDGEPLEGATVLFQPASGRPSRGTTDNRGHYELSYTQDRAGAVVGPHTVHITTAETITQDDGTMTATPERVPERYNRSSELTVEVPAGGTDSADFQLESDA